MSFKSLLFESDQDFAEMMPALWEAFENPFNSFLRIVFYLKGNSPEERLPSIETAAAGTLALHKMNPNSYWMKVVHESGRLIGAANWILNKENPYTGGGDQEPVVATWWPEGVGRDYANLNISFTIPSHHRHRAGNLVMEWGVQQADKLGVGSFVEASAEGKFLYDKWGFLHFDTLIVDTKIENPSEEWERLERELKPTPQYLMWRPVGGVFELGKTCLPWETRPFVPKTG